MFARDHTPENNPNKRSININTNAPANNTAPNTSATQATSAASTPSGNTGTPVATTVKAGSAAGHTLYRHNASGILTQGKLTNISNGYYVY